MFKRKPFAVLLFGLALASAVAYSQTRQTRTITSQQWDMMQKTMRERFAAADKNGDGRLTREEANGKMPRVYNNFQIIDRGGKGYVTLQEIEKSVKDNVAIEGTAK
jgi:Ca2+-binding EF-hand superfamily protein